MLPLMLVAIALALVVMAQFARHPVDAGAVTAGVSDPRSAPRHVVRNGIEHLDARSGLVDYSGLDRRLDALVEDPAMVGLAVAVVENGEIAFARGYGETAEGSDDPVTVDTVFRWASLSKGVASTMVALLARDGAFALDTPLSRLAPSLRLPGHGQMRADVTDLLSHRLGIERNAYDYRLEADESPRLLRLALSRAPEACPPDDCHRYQNIAFDAASEIVENVTGLSYEAAVQQRLLRPLGMRTASVSRRGLFESASWARSHVGAGHEVPVLEPYYRIPAAGGMNGSIRDLAIWMQAQMGAAPDVVPAGVVSLIHRPVVRTEREDRRNRRFGDRFSNARYALGWRVYDYAGHEVIGHRGAVRGYRAMILFDPALRSGVVALWNSHSSRPYDIPMAVFDQLYGLDGIDWIADPEQAEAPQAASATQTAATATIEGRRRPGDSRDSASSP